MSRARKYEGDEMLPPSKLRNCLKCRIQFEVFPPDNFYTCNKCRIENSRINDRLIPSDRGHHIIRKSNNRVP